MQLEALLQAFPKVNLHPPVMEIDLSSLGYKQLRLSMRRDDLIHPIVSGNKLLKLIPHLQAQDILVHIVTCGGTHSNHIHSAAYLAARLGIKCTLVIREGEAFETPTLNDCKAWGAEILHVSRSRFRALREQPQLMQQIDPSACIIPEGGAGREAFLLESNVESYDQILVPVGTGTTAQSFVKYEKPVLGFSSFAYLQKDEPKLTIKPLDSPKRFAEYSMSAMKTAKWLLDTHNILLDPLYTAPSLAAFLKQTQDEPAHILMIHTGGLQSWRSYLKRFAIQIDPHFTRQIKDYIEQLDLGRPATA